MLLWFCCCCTCNYNQKPWFKSSFYAAVSGSNRCYFCIDRTLSHSRSLSLSPLYGHHTLLLHGQLFLGCFFICVISKIISGDHFEKVHQHDYVIKIHFGFTLDRACTIFTSSHPTDNLLQQGLLLSSGLKPDAGPQYCFALST